MATPEELAAQEAAKGGTPPPAGTPPPVTPPVVPQPFVLQGEHIPEALRGKTDKEVVELLLNTSAEAERLKGQISAKDVEIEQLKPKPSLEQMSEAEKKALREKEFINDPIAFLDKHHAERMKPLTEEYYRGQAEVTLNMAKRDKERYPNFAVLEKDIKVILDKMPADIRSNPQTIDFVYKMAEYPVLQKMVKEGKVRDGMFVEGGSSPPPEVKPKVVLDDDEKTVAKRFGMTDDDYIKYSGKGTIDEF
jgi:hypothetical protein